MLSVYYVYLILFIISDIVAKDLAKNLHMTLVVSNLNNKQTCQPCQFSLEIAILVHLIFLV